MTHTDYFGRSELPWDAYDNWEEPVGEYRMCEYGKLIKKVLDLGDANGNIQGH
jgi:hypothetical protein